MAGRKYRYSLTISKKILYTDSALAVLAFWGGIAQGCKSVSFKLSLIGSLTLPHIFFLALFAWKREWALIARGRTMVQTFTTVGGKAASDVIRSLSFSYSPLEHLWCARRLCRNRGAPLGPFGSGEAVRMTLSVEYFTPLGCRLHSVCSLTQGVRMCKSLVSWVNSFFYYLITWFTVLQDRSVSDLEFMEVICQKSYYED